MQAGAAEAGRPEALDERDGPPELRGADRGDVAARAAAEHEQVGGLGELADDHQRRSSRSSTGSSRSATTCETNAASVWPSSTRWSPATASASVGRTTGRAADRDDLVADRPHAEVGDLGRADDRRAQPDAEAAVVVDRERRPRELLRAHPAVVDGARERDDLEGHLGQRPAAGVVDDRDHEAVGAAHRDADVVVAVQRELLALEVDRRVDVGVVAERAHGRAGR